MRSANHIALMTLRLEGYGVEHIKKSSAVFKGVKHGRCARWMVSYPPSDEWCFRSPSEAVYYLIENKMTGVTYWWHK